MSQIQRAIAREGQHLIDQLPDVRETLGTLQSRVRDLDSRARELIQDRPLTALAVAVAIGFVLRRFLPLGRG